MNDWFAEHAWITFLIIFLLVSYVYNKVFRVRRLPILKAAVVYLLLALGSLLLLVFQVDARLPIIPSLAVAVLMMLMYRIRLWVTNRSGNQEG